MNIKESLTRKFGPLPAWAWILLFGVGVWYYRNKMSGAASASGTGTGSVGPAASNQAPVPLQPGESVYDPASGALETAPGGGGGNGTTGTSGGTDIGTALDDLATAIGNATQNGSAPGAVTNNYYTNPPAKSKRKVKAKTKKAKSTTKPKLGLRRNRSTATTRASSTRNRGGNAPTSGRPRTTVHPAAGSGITSRPRQTTPATRTVTRQRPATTHPRQVPSRQSGAPAPRPSAPPPRRANRNRR